MSAASKGEAGRGAKADAGSARPKRATPGSSRNDIHTQPTEIHMPAKSDIPEAIRQQLDAPTYNALARAIVEREKAAEQAGYARAVREYAAALRTETPEKSVDESCRDWTLIICTTVMLLTTLGLAVLMVWSPRL
jgi:hypothetical protein